MSGTIFLSASFPNGNRPGESGVFFPADIAAAASAVVEGTLRSGGRLVFGGHPTITPLVLNIASMLQAGDRILCYQSLHFEGQFTDEMIRLIGEEGAVAKLTPDEGELKLSLMVLREDMLANQFQGAFFVGGMSGIRDELAILQRIQPATPMFAFQAPGGAAGSLVGHSPGGPVGLDQAGGAPWREEGRLRDVRPLMGRAYSSLVLQALEEVGLTP
ncbi:hypothetical protein GCM10022381_38670 [Leifsonia kafniensis]|uniref:Uncharacterized protein n=1 Tax=Leifsonia kafniensis TaxID=475957 RepID=A0ABP7L3G0_9MICO